MFLTLSPVVVQYLAAVRPGHIERPNATGLRARKRRLIHAGLVCLF